MDLKRSLAAASVVGLLFAAGGVRAETKVELKGVHLCCVACVKAANDILKTVDGVTGHCDPKNKTITISAPDDQTAQKALDALAEGGFHGDTGNKDLAIKNDNGVSSGKVSSVTVTGLHNCCMRCCGEIKRAVKKVNGVTGDTAKPKAKSFTVTGDFDPEELVKALNDAGFHARVQK